MGGFRRFSFFIVFSAATLFAAGVILFGGSFYEQLSNRLPFKTSLASNDISSEWTPSIDSAKYTVSPLPSHTISHQNLAEAYLSDDTLKEPLRIVITENSGYHEEVVAAFVHSFGSQKNSQLDLYQKVQRYGITDIMKAFKLQKPVLDSKAPPEFCQAEGGSTPHVVVASTCAVDALTCGPRLKSLLQQGQTHLFCVIHHADHWERKDLQEALIPWIENGRMDFVGLSEHTSRFLERVVKGWNTTVMPRFRYFVPVFPVSLPALPSGNDIMDAELGFAMQGLYETYRRDYNTIFTHLESFINSKSSRGGVSDNSNVTLHLLGAGKRPKVPDSLISHVKFDESLAYVEYYSILARAFALLPAFANDEYLDRKASSTVPAGLIGGTPLVATKEIMDSYSYLSEDVVYLQKDGETEFDVIRRVLKAEGKHRVEKMQLVRNRTAKMIEGNTRLVEKWIKESKVKPGW